MPRTETWMLYGACASSLGPTRKVSLTPKSEYFSFSSSNASPVSAYMASLPGKNTKPGANAGSASYPSTGITDTPSNVYSSSCKGLSCTGFLLKHRIVVGRIQLHIEVRELHGSGKLACHRLHGCATHPAP